MHPPQDIIAASAAAFVETLCVKSENVWCGCVTEMTKKIVIMTKGVQRMELALGNWAFFNFILISFINWDNDDSDGALNRNRDFGGV